MYICRVALFYFIPEIQRIRSEQVKTDNSFMQLFHLTFKLYVSSFFLNLKTHIVQSIKNKEKYCHALF